MRVTVETFIKTKIVNAATGKTIKESPFRKNLVLDQGLNGLARDTSQSLQCTPASCSTFCLIGDGTTPNAITGAVTFSQAGTAITSSGGFFTSGMVGGILKTSVAEVYITAFINSTSVTGATSATYAGEAGTVYQVQQTAMANFLFRSSTYQTNSGDCGTTFSGTQAYHQRTYVFPQQVATYNVNEIGYSPIGSNTKVVGRFVLPSTDVVTSANFYVVVIGIRFTYTPNTPTAVANVGTNINTSGNSMIEFWAVTIIQADGTISIVGRVPVLDGAVAVFLCFATAAYTQGNPIINSGTGVVFTGLIINSGKSWTYSGTVGKMTLTFNGTTTTSGQTATGVGFCQSAGDFHFLADIKFTTGQALPNGAFQPITVWSMTYNRTL